MGVDVELGADEHAAIREISKPRSTANSHNLALIVLSPPENYHFDIVRQKEAIPLAVIYHGIAVTILGERLFRKEDLKASPEECNISKNHSPGWVKMPL